MFTVELLDSHKRPVSTEWNAFRIAK